MHARDPSYSRGWGGRTASLRPPGQLGKAPPQTKQGRGAAHPALVLGRRGSVTGSHQRPTAAAGSSLMWTERTLAQGQRGSRGLLASLQHI